VVGIVASRLLERFGKSVYLICLAEGVGKGSARGGAGANLAGTLAGAADLLQTYGGHEQAAGFSLTEENIPAFRARLAELLSAQGGVQEGPSLSVDGLLSPALFNYGNIDDLRALEPYGTGNPVPVFALEIAALERVTPVGGGRHVKLTLRIGDMEFPGIFFGVTPLSLGFTEGDTVDVAFRAEINDFQNRKQAQLQLCDMRLAAPAREREAASLALYRRFRASEPLGKAERAALCPDRTCLGAVWRYLKRGAGPVTDQTAALARKISRAAGFPVLTGVLLAALDVFAELGLVLRYQVGDEVTLTPKAGPEKVDLSASEVLGRLTVGE
jgi:single-stranded-DNA-specific exonuclease